MKVILSLSADEESELRDVAQTGRSTVEAVVTALVRERLGRWRDMTEHLERVVEEDTELLRRLADS